MNTKLKQNAVGPFIRALRMRKGWSQASLSARLEMAGWKCSRSRLAKIECGLITVRDRDSPHFLNIFAMDIDALYPAEVSRVERIFGFDAISCSPSEKSSYRSESDW